MFGGIVAIFIIIGIGLYTTRGLRRGNGPSRFEEIMGQIEAGDQRELWGRLCWIVLATFVTFGGNVLMSGNRESVEAVDNRGDANLVTLRRFSAKTIGSSIIEVG